MIRQLVARRALTSAGPQRSSVREHRHRPAVQAAALRAASSRAGWSGIDPDSDGLGAGPGRGPGGVAPRVSTGCSARTSCPTSSSRPPRPRSTPRNAPALRRGAGSRAIDLTPAAVGPYVVPPVNLGRAHRRAEREHGDLWRAGDHSDGACGHPRRERAVRGDRRHGRVGVGGPGHAGEHRRVHRDHGARGGRGLGGARRGKAIIILNPAEPPLIMRDTIFCSMPADVDRDAVDDSVRRDGRRGAAPTFPAIGCACRPAVRRRTGSPSSSRSRARATSSRRTPATSTS